MQDGLLTNNSSNINISWLSSRLILTISIRISSFHLNMS